MKDIETWFRRAANRESRAQSLFISFLRGNISSYFFYRLRISLTLDVARFIFHVVEFLIILASFGEAAAAIIVFLRTVSMIALGSWWGTLESMREDLRGLAIGKDRKVIEKEIGKWLQVSLVISIVVLVVGLLSVKAIFHPMDIEIQFYVALILLELAIRFPVQVLHSGIFATRRIYRPPWSLSAPIVTQIIVISLGTFFYPEFAAFIALIAANAVGLYLTSAYTLQAYKFVGIQPKLEIPRSIKRQPVSTARCIELLKVTVAGLCLRVDSIVLLIVLGGYGTENRAFDLTAGASDWRDFDAVQFFYLALPLLRGAYETTGIFYFDLVKLGRNPALVLVHQFFFRKILWASAWAAIFFWMLAAFLGLIILSDVPVSFILALSPLFLMRALIGAYQVRMFADRRFIVLMATNVFLAASLILVWIDINPASDLVHIMAAMLALLILNINLKYYQDRTANLPSMLSLGDWIDSLKRDTTGKHPTPVVVGKIELRKMTPISQKNEVIKLLKKTFDGNGYFTFRTRTSILYYIKQDAHLSNMKENSISNTHVHLQTLTAGILGRGKNLSGSGNGIAERLVKDKWVPPPNAGHFAPKTIVDEFVSLFPSGVYLDLAEPSHYGNFRELNQAFLREVLVTSTRSLESSTIITRLSGHSVSPIFHEGCLRLIFVLPPDSYPDAVEIWVQLVKDWNHRKIRI